MVGPLSSLDSHPCCADLFSPSNVILSFRDENGNIMDPAQFVDFKPDGSVARVKLPKRSIWISNHQVYTDWLYLWIISYFCGLESSIVIILKESLKWAPLIGLAMQLFDFIFLARSWIKDQRTLSHHLSKLARLSHLDKSPLTLLIFPEGTLVSKDTRPQSKKYADKMGLEDCRNVLLPRSTGLLYCARTLRKEIEDLTLVDATIGYPGIPPAGYGQSYYTLRSIYMQGVPPPSVHISITLRRIAPSSPTADVDNAAKESASMPIGDISSLSKDASPRDLDPSEAERQIFDAWLLARWREKDELLDQFYKDGDFVGGAFVRNKNEAGEYYRPAKDDTVGGGDGIKTESHKKYVSIPVALRSPLEVLDVYAYGLPLIVGWLVWRWMGM